MLIFNTEFFIVTTVQTVPFNPLTQKLTDISQLHISL